MSEQNDQIADGNHQMENYGTAGMSTSSTQKPKKPVTRYNGATRVIRWPLLCPYGAPPAELVDQLKWVNSGTGRPIFVLFPNTKGIPLSAHIGKLRAICGLQNVRFSVRSAKKTRILVSASYSSKITEPPKPIPPPGEKKAA